MPQVCVSVHLIAIVTRQFPRLLASMDCLRHLVTSLDHRGGTGMVGDSDSMSL